MTDRLNSLIDRATRGVLLGDEATALREEIANLRAQARRATSAATTADCQQAYHAQVRRQLDEARQAVRSAENELGPLRQRVQELAAERDQAAIGVPLICSDERHDAKVRGLEAVLREVLATFVHQVHPGRPCLQSQMISTERVAKWRAALEGGLTTRAGSRPVVDTCHTVTVDGETVRVRGAGPLGPVAEVALAEVIRLARARLAEHTPTSNVPPSIAAESPAQLHARSAHPGWEYATTTGPRKQWDFSDVPPDGDGWERNVDKGRDGWERWDYTEESYWRRPTPPATQPV